MKYALAFALAIALVSTHSAVAITIDTVPIGKPGNPGRVQGGIYGSVATTYRIATTEVTNAQYTMFLNAVAASDPHTLYNTNMGFASRGGIVRSGSDGSYTYSVKADVEEISPGGPGYTYGDKPVVYVSWYDAARFANWVNNGATAGASTETGAYTMANGVNVSRNAGATWFLPTEDQWYKAAYYYDNGTPAGVYFDYPTKSNTAPDNHVPLDDTGNSANYFAGALTEDISYPFTPVGAYSASKSPYGTSDQGGNVWEWTETYTSSNSSRVRRGGSFSSDATKISSAYRESINPATENDDTMGFRLAAITTPAGVLGDYNANGVVDAGDYVLWRKYSGQSVILPNDSTPGSVGPADFDVWRSHFGQTGSGSGSGTMLSNAVPEPSVILLGLAGLISLAFLGRSRKFATPNRPRLY